MEEETKDTAETAHELSKYFTGVTRTMMRSEIKGAEYNPRRIHPDALKSLKRGIRRFGIVGGIVVNARTGNTIVGGHQRMAVADQLHGWPASDYAVKAEVVDLDEKEEKELNILLNNPNTQGVWDFDKLRQLIPDIDYKTAGLTEVDLSMIGCDFTLETESARDMLSDLNAMNKPVDEWRRGENERRRQERESSRSEDESVDDRDTVMVIDGNTHPMTDEEKIAHMKDVKRQVREHAQGKVRDMEAYVVLSFDSIENKMAFCERFELNPYEKFIKGEVFDALFDDD